MPARLHPSSCLLCIIALHLLSITTTFAAAPVDFDTQIAPLLAARCLECHNTTDHKGKLDLSSAATALRMKDAVIVPGKIDASLLWEQVAGDEMPPKKPLSAAEKTLLKSWIESGAKWGVTDPINRFAYTTDRSAGLDWWSLQPITKSALPAVKNQTWPRNEVDRFILAKLESQNLSPAPQADRRTLIRRVTFDLTGLPPSPVEVDAFVNDKSDDAYAKLIDRLLASPHYGERWARHWLDVIRFGESQGFERNRIREGAWKFRDWVIDAFNADLPYDEFVRLQLAGDAFKPDDASAVLATGYLVCGTWDQVGHNEGSTSMRLTARQDHLEDQVAALGQSFLGLTIQCARCHDHKFDPIMQEEYYKIAAALSDVNQEEKERQSLFDAKTLASMQSKLDAELAPITARMKELESKARAAITKESQPTNEPQIKRISDQLAAMYGFSEGSVNTIRNLAGDDALNLIIRDTGSIRWHERGITIDKPTLISTRSPAKSLSDAIRKSKSLTLEAWIQPADDKQAGPARIITLSRDSGQRNFTLGQDGNKYEVRLRTTTIGDNGAPGLTTPAGSVTTDRPVHFVYTLAADKTASIYINGSRIAQDKIKGELDNWSSDFQLALGNELSADRPWRGTLSLVAIYTKALSESEIKQNLSAGARGISSQPSLAMVLGKLSDKEQSEYQSLLNQTQARQRQFDAMNSPAHVVISKQPPVTHVLARGDLNNPKQIVPPAGVAALNGLSSDFGLAPDATGPQRRVKLAQWITDPRNPLTARVLVNRVWAYHFGTGIVDTPSDFGFNGGRPTHPQLLDHLASEFIGNKWSIKQLHRIILMSATYQQTSRHENPSAQKFDADNRLLWRMNTRQLEGEAVRDAMLAVAGVLNDKQGGPSFRDVKVKLGTNHEFTDPTYEFNSEMNRRTIYRLWARSGNHPMLLALDCPDPTVTVPRRSRTITPVAALSLLNSPFAENCGKAFASRVREKAGKNVTDQVNQAYALAYQRPPALRELELAMRFIEGNGLEQFCIVLFNANEFLFLD